MPGPGDDPFERTHSGSLQQMFDKECDHQWIIDLYEKFTGKPLTRRKQGSTRIIARWWPRDPKGKMIRDVQAGKETPNSTHLWGQTLLDFFRFQRWPDQPHVMTTSTSSRLSRWMMENGESEHSKDDMEWAAREEEPKLKPGADMMEIIYARDLMVMMGLSGESMIPDNQDEQIKKSPVLPFDYSNYPDPWPLIPFSSKPPNLQSHIPFHLLPETLIVHDPFELLRGNARCRDLDDAWTSVEDIVHKYRLNLTVDSIRQTIDAERAKITEAAESAEPIMIGVLTKADSEFPPEVSSEISGIAYKLTVPPPPPPQKSTPEAHLYISPAQAIGRGNHSYVYRAEWDVPRSVFSNPKICTTCVTEAAVNILQVMNEKSEKAPLDLTPGTFIRLEKRTSRLTFSFVADATAPIDKDKQHTLEEATTLSYAEFTGPISTLHVDTVPWYDSASTDPPPCPHLWQEFVSGPLPGPVPPTTKVSVAAKLSMPGDAHLEREAINYQHFGSQFSQNWTGYTLAYPIQNPTPMNAITPVFYGYYSKEKSADASDSEYYSPILLLEDCGEQIDPEELDFDDRQECGALLLRLHYHGWTQGSYASRNILVQRGDPGDFPLMKSQQDRRFRLIDFGRAKSLKKAKEADLKRGDEKNTEADAWDLQRFNEKSEIGNVLCFEFPT
ncbi:hypothetical protein BDP27DRAFT_1405261 [Rhodocollybia butyracea]|uniref:Protein kinase domain-containing protein n=1 Tax=Rhodocollybia butyracea TaxID=206335 RepID=A0A9P5PJZ2_9AGAR|nr:hypothetical protein BDP27DRAFT_1405261 [Rhodocollybia butyracea]